jgi:Tol biopolymer transport system component
MTSLRLSQVAVLGVLAMITAVGCTERAGADASDDSGTSGTSTSSSSGTSGSSTSGGGGDTSGASSGGSSTTGGGGDTTGNETSTSAPEGRGEIAFTRQPQGGTAQIFGMEMDGSNVRQLTFDDEAGFLPRWAPDGSVLAFSRGPRDGSARELWLIDPESGDETYLATGHADSWSVEWSPDGTHIAFVVEGEGDGQEKPEIYVVATDGTGQTNLTTDPGTDRSPSWPEGGRIFFASDRGDIGYQIYSMDEDGGDPTALTDVLASNLDPVASPDGSRVAFERVEGETPDFYLMNGDGTDEIRVTDSVAYVSYQDAMWSPDGRYVAFTRREGGQKRILRVEADGAGLIELWDMQGSDEYPSWTPDSQQIVFVSDRDDEDGEIYVMNADGSNPTRLTNDPAWDDEPTVRPGG